MDSQSSAEATANNVELISIQMDDEIVEKLKKLSSVTLDCDWTENGLWRSWSSLLDNSGLHYLLPDEYVILCKCTNMQPQYIKAKCIDITMYIIGHDCNVQQKEIFWNTGADVGHILAQWGSFLQNKMADIEQHTLIQGSYQEALTYFTKHRELVRRVGKRLNVPMDDHDLTKSTLVHYALGYMWHWPKDKLEKRDKAGEEIALKVIRQRHLEMESHHPEYKPEFGEIEIEKMFCDRLAVHLQKDGADDENGWKIDPWIPQQYKEQWMNFKLKWKGENLNSILEETYELPLEIAIFKP